MMALFSEKRAEIASEVSRDSVRWSEEIKYYPGRFAIKALNKHIQERPDFLMNHLNEVLNLNGYSFLEITSNNPKGGRIFVEGVKLSDYPFKGRFFNNVEVFIKVKPRVGYTFKGWKERTESDHDELDLKITADTKLEAVFEKTNP